MKDHEEKPEEIEVEKPKKNEEDQDVAVRIGSPIPTDPTKPRSL